MLTVLNPCNVATFTVPTVTTQNYTVNNNALVYNFPAFTTNQTQCNIAYTLTYLNGSAYPTSIITNFDSTNRNITVYTTSESLVGTYQLEIIATLSDSLNSNSASVPINITVISDYPSTIVTTTAISNTNFTLFTSGPVVYPSSGFTSFSYSPGSCGNINYTATLTNGSALPGFITFTNSSRQFTI